MLILAWTPAFDEQHLQNGFGADILYRAQFKKILRIALHVGEGAGVLLQHADAQRPLDHGDGVHLTEYLCLFEFLRGLVIISEMPCLGAMVLKEVS